jgi:hypothetical protein
VKRFAVILITFLSLLLSGRDVSAAVSFQTETKVCLSATFSDTICKDSKATLGREMCIIAYGGNAFSGNTTSHGSSVRLSQTCRRIHSSTKTTFKLVKAGKVMDGRGCFLRGFSLFQPLPDNFSFNQHLHLMGILRL